MAKHMMSFRISEGMVEQAQKSFSNYGLKPNKSETVELALDLLYQMCEEIFEKSDFHNDPILNLRDKVVLSRIMYTVCRNPEVKDVASDLCDRYYDRLDEERDKK